MSRFDTAHMLSQYHFIVTMALHHVSTPPVFKAPVGGDAYQKFANTFSIWKTRMTGLSEAEESMMMC